MVRFRPLIDDIAGEIFPLTIIRDRYTGSYSKGAFLAFNMEPWDIPKEVFEDDVTCDDFWKEYRGVVGRGGSIEDAVKDLANQLGLEIY